MGEGIAGTYVCPGVILLVTSVVYLKLVCFHGVSLTYKFSLFTLLCLPATGLLLLQPQCSLERSAPFAHLLSMSLKFTFTPV